MNSLFMPLLVLLMFAAALLAFWAFACWHQSEALKHELARLARHQVQDEAQRTIIEMERTK